MLNPAEAPYRAGGAEFRNNIVYDTLADATQPHVQALLRNGATAADTAGFRFGANVYYPDGADPDGSGPLTGMFRWAGSLSALSTNLAGWGAVAGIMESGSSTLDPGFPAAAATGNFPWAGTPTVLVGGGDYRPAALAGSPVVNRGVAALNAPDILGNPVAGAPDIGAYELPYADLGVAITATPQPATQGGTITYTTTVRNLGPLAALAVSATGSLPPCAMPILAPDDTASCSTTVPVTGTTVPQQVMSVAGADADLSTADNTASATVIVDSDGDGVRDAVDNCRLVRNGPADAATAGPSQRDSNGDGFGNICDGDLDNNGAVGNADLALMRAAYGSGAWPDRDLDGSGSVNALDLALFRLLFGRAPGPSGLVP